MKQVMAGGDSHRRTWATTYSGQPLSCRRHEEAVAQSKNNWPPGGPENRFVALPRTTGAAATFGHTAGIAELREHKAMLLRLLSYTTAYGPGRRGQDTLARGLQLDPTDVGTTTIWATYSLQREDPGEGAERMVHMLWPNSPAKRPITQLPGC